MSIFDPSVQQQVTPEFEHTKLVSGTSKDDLLELTTMKTTAAIITFKKPSNINGCCRHGIVIFAEI
jgi:hypothetical protein